MPQSFCQLYSHLIFSTKNRTRFLDSSIRSQVHSYMAGHLRNIECQFIHIGGTEDHIHIFCSLSKKHAPIDIVANLKKESSKFAKTLGSDYRNFYWQKGYGLFSVGCLDNHAVIKYINNQEKHHKKMTFKEEYRAYLEKYGIDYDEQYVWD